MSTTGAVGGSMLVAAPERWDEACFCAPAVRAMVAGGLGVGVLCGDAQVDFWSTLDGIAVIGMPERPKARQVAPELAGQWQAALMWETGVAAESCLRAKIPRRIGPAGKPLGKWLTHPVEAPEASGPPGHRVRDYLRIVEALGVETARPEFFLPADPGVAPEAGTVLLCPDSDLGRSHEWLLERWLEVAQALVADGCRVTVAGLPGGAGLGRQLADRLGEVPFFEEAALPLLLPLLAVHAVVVVADGSLAHLASHVGATCVTLFGPNDPAWRRPLGRRHAVVRRHVECAPCFLARCPLDGRCQRELETARVLAAVREKLA